MLVVALAISFILAFSILAQASSAAAATATTSADFQGEGDVVSEANLGEYTTATVRFDGERAELEVVTGQGDLEDGEYNITFFCVEPEIFRSFENALGVQGGQGSASVDLELEVGEYPDCEVTAGDLVSGLPPFTIGGSGGGGGGGDNDDDDGVPGGSDDGDDDDNSGNDGDNGDDDGSGEGQDGQQGGGDDGGVPGGVDGDDDNNTNGTEDGQTTDSPEDDEGGGQGAEARLDILAGGVEIQVKIRQMDIEAGRYDAVFACDDPAKSLEFEERLRVTEDGVGELWARVPLQIGTYTGCEVSAAGPGGRQLIAAFDDFTVYRKGQLPEDFYDYEKKLEEKKKERKRAIVEGVVAQEAHQRHLDEAGPADPGDYRPGQKYVLEADGTAAEKGSNSGSATDAAEVSLDIAVWRSNKAIVLMDVLGGSAQIGNETYDIKAGYALYSINSGALRVGALAVAQGDGEDDDGGSDVLKLKIRGEAENDDASLPKAGGDDDEEVIELRFTAGGSGGSGRLASHLDGRQLWLDGSISVQT